jgi:hypothetical protein
MIPAIRSIYINSTINGTEDEFLKHLCELNSWNMIECASQIGLKTEFLRRKMRILGLYGTKKKKMTL